jgi:hypothetical protein
MLEVCGVPWGVRVDSLCSVGEVVHEEEVDVARVLDEEGLVAGGHQMAGLLVGTVTDLEASTVNAAVGRKQISIRGPFSSSIHLFTEPSRLCVAPLAWPPGP